MCYHRPDVTYWCDICTDTHKEKSEAIKKLNEWEENERDIFKEDEINRDENIPSGTIPNQLISASTLSQVPTSRRAPSPAPP